MNIPKKKKKRQKTNNKVDFQRHTSFLFVSDFFFLGEMQKNEGDNAQQCKMECYYVK